MFLWIGRRVSLRRLLVGLLIMGVLILSCLHLWRMDIEMPEISLPKLNEESYSGNDNGKLELPEKVPDGPMGGDDSSQGNNVEMVFSDENFIDQEAPFQLMKIYQDYTLLYNNKINGHLMVGRQNVTEYDPDPHYQRENATFFSLVRNDDFAGIIKAIQSVETRFNRRYGYDWVFANDKPFHPTFKAVVSNLVSGMAHFVEIPPPFWGYPDWIDQDKAEDVREVMKEKKVKYGDSESYRHMCRFNLGLFFQLPIMKKFRYYWRVEPDILYGCDIFETDWFKHMRQNNKKYAFTLAPLELHTTVVGLWDSVKEFAEKHPKLVAKDNNMAFLTEDGGATYNMCHFWSNFEIGDMDFFRSEAYTKFFNHIDRAGGFYYSRWGDAPVHTMAVSLLLPKDDLFFLQNTGYFHKPNGDCPHDPKIRLERRCVCEVKGDATWKKSLCIPKWFEVHNIEKPDFVPKYKFENQHHPDPERDPEVDEDED